YQSAKARDIAENPNVSVLFPWLGLERQVRITGVAEKISTMESFKYFSSRPRGSQMGAWISAQSSVISSRSMLKTKLQQIKDKFKQGQIPLPDAWGGYRIIPSSFEFWQGRTNRLHDRIKFELNNDQQWSITRLAP
ncbi:MAG: pyridoxamine 5'-phosphate oxidase, partial [Proteobacteria bacterium]|nr:pyridoxamine 5'-phosphate oxidase [Pseudomonadota bacterium]